MKKFYLIAILALMLLVTACSNEVVEVADTEVVKTSVEVTPKATFESVELKIANGMFFPDTIIVEEGTQLMILFDQQFIFALPDFNIAEDVQAGYEIEFVADKKGKFPYFCDGCSEKTIGYLEVI